MPHCPNCGERHDPGMNYCPGCGTSLPAGAASVADGERNGGGNGDGEGDGDGDGNRNGDGDAGSTTSGSASTAPDDGDDEELDSAGEGLLKMAVAGVVGIVGAYYVTGGPFVDPTGGENYNLSFFIVALLVYAVLVYVID